MLRCCLGLKVLRLLAVLAMQSGCCCACLALGAVAKLQVVRFLFAFSALGDEARVLV